MSCLPRELNSVQKKKKKSKTKIVRLRSHKILRALIPAICARLVSWLITGLRWAVKLQREHVCSLLHWVVRTVPMIAQYWS